MFELNESNMISNKEKLLFNIQELLKEQNKILKGDLKEEVNLEELKRSQLLTMVKELPKKPKNYAKLKNEELINLLR